MDFVQEQSLKSSRHSGRFYLVVPHIFYYFWRAECYWHSRRSMLYARYAKGIQELRSQALKSVQTFDHRPHVQLQIAPPSLVCLQMQVCIISSLFPFPFLNVEVRAALGWIRAVSGRKPLSVESWPHFLQMWEDLGNSRRRRENLAGKTEGFCLERLDFAMNLQQNSEQIT